jgi:hypothetical protein
MYNERGEAFFPRRATTTQVAFQRDPQRASEPSNTAQRGTTAPSFKQGLASDH